MTPDSKPTPQSVQRCAGPNCGVLKGTGNHWWMIWTSQAKNGKSVLSLAPWDDEIAVRESALPVCGEQCAYKLQSQFMDNLLREQQRARASGNTAT